MQAESLRGVCAAVLTPLDEQLRPDAPRARTYYRSLLDSGCDSLNVLGTSGEAMSLSLAQRLTFMEAIAGSGLPRERMMVGTGAAALEDAMTLTAAAMRLQFAAALVMPPFYFRSVGADGVLQFFRRLIDSVRPEPGRIFLYHYPAVSGVAFSPEIIDALMREHPGVIGGIKDSSNDVQFQRTLHERHPDLLIYPSSEALLSDARREGFAGCISGTVALWPQLAARVWSGEEALQPQLTRNREAIAKLPLIPAVRAVLAARTGDAAWRRSIPPLTPILEAQLEEVNAAVG